MAFVQLKVMKALHDHWRNPFVHSYFWLETAAGERYVVEGYPEETPQGRCIREWIYAGDIGHYGLSMGPDQPTVWTYSGDAAAAADRILAAARDFPRCRTPYRMFRGPNSNSFIRYLALQAGIPVHRPDFAVGWNAEILGV
jgi:hypothetical protein